MIIVDNPGRDSWEDLCLRNDSEAPEITEIVAGILADVIANGDEALIRLTKQFDGVALTSLSVPTAGATVAPELEEAILVASRNITAFHRAQKESVVEIETSPGIQCWRKSVGIERVGLYVPGGSAPLFSTVLMLGIPAQLAGCSEVILFTPPQKDGSVHPAILFAANQAGINEVVPVGGAQAIAAMAYGTESIAPVDKIFGPGKQ